MRTHKRCTITVSAGLAAALLATGAATCIAEEAIVIGSWCDGSVGPACDAAFRVDLATGQRTLLSAYSEEDAQRDAITGNARSAESRNRGGTFWNGVAVSADGTIYVMAAEHPDPKLWESLYSIDPATGDRQLLSPLADPSLGPVIGSRGTSFTRLVATPGGRLLMHENSAGGAIITIDPTSGKRSLFSDPSDSNQGPGFTYFLGLDPQGGLFATETGVSASASLLEIDSETGRRSIVSQVPAGTAVPNNALGCGAGPEFAEGGLKGASNQLFCSDQFNVDQLRFNLDTVNTETGERRLLSDFGATSQGPLLGMPRAQVWAQDGRLLVLDDGNVNTEGLGGIQAVDPATGARTLLSDFTDARQGPLIYFAKSIAVGLPSSTAKPSSPGTTGQPKGPIATEGLSQSESQDPVWVGQSVTYTLSFTNSGATQATKVKLTDLLPQKARLESVVASQGTCKGKAKVVCTLDSLAAGNTWTVAIKLTARKQGVYRNKVQVTFTAQVAGSGKPKRIRAVSRETTNVLR